MDTDTIVYIVLSVCFLAIIIVCVMFIFLPVKITFTYPGTILRTRTEESSRDIEGQDTSSLRVCFCVCSTENSSPGVYIPNCKRLSYMTSNHGHQFKKERVIWLMCCRKEFPLVNDACPICLEAFLDNEEMIVLSCSHGFHEHCLAEWIKQKLLAPCPLCKTQLRVDSIQFDPRNYHEDLGYLVNGHNRDYGALGWTSSMH